MKKTTTIENVSRAEREAFERLAATIHTRHVIRCNKCDASDEFNEGDSLDAAAWFQMIGWTANRAR